MRRSTLVLRAKNNTEVAGPTGPQGATGPAGLQGSIGLQGAAGLRGPQGAIGATGLQGPAGGGDLLGTYPNPTITKINGVHLTLGGGANGDVLTQQLDGSFAPAALPSQSIAFAKLEGIMSAGNFSLNARNTLLVDPVSFAYGNWSDSQSTPMIAYNAGNVGVFNSLTVDHVNTTNDFYDLQVSIIVTNQAQTQTATISCFATTGMGGVNSSVSILPSACGVSAYTGNDLSFDPGDGDINTAAGGIYAVHISYNGFWD